MKTHPRIFCAQLICAALVAALPVPAFAQTPTAAAKAEGKAFGREKAKAAQDAATTTPDAQSIPNFDANPSQTVMYDNPDAMAPSAAAQADAHEGYRAMRSSQASRARFAPVDLDATIARAQAINDDPLTYTSGMSVTGTQGRCVPLPGSTASNGRYMATCNSGTTATQVTKSCQIPLEVAVTPTTAYTYWCSVAGTDRFNRVDDCALFESRHCTETGTRPGVCLEWEIGPLRERYCIEPGEPISILSCPSQVPGATLRATTTQNAVTAVRNESQCQTIASDSNCTHDAETCTDSDPVTRIVDGVSVTQPCWSWERSYTCSKFAQAQDCE
ncbi:MAG: hypothetical protein RL481_2010, partial [Pseudomonadota bacterium]